MRNEKLMWVGLGGSQVEALAALLQQLPLKVRCKMRMDVMERALSEQLFSIGEDGQLHWAGGNHTTLAYFCGRMFCGDHGQYSRRLQEQVWVQGKGQFPAVDIGRLFGVTTLKQSRYRRKNMPLPECWQLIDALF